MDLEALALARVLRRAAGASRTTPRSGRSRAWLDEGDEVRAAYVAIAIARNLGRLGKLSIAAGWVRRAERLLPEGGDTYAHGYLALGRSEAAARAATSRRRWRSRSRPWRSPDAASDADLRAWGLAHLGELKIAIGATRRPGSRCWRRPRSPRSTASCRRSRAASPRAG